MLTIAQADEIAERICKQREAQEFEESRKNTRWLTSEAGNLWRLLPGQVLQVISLVQEGVCILYENRKPKGLYKTVDEAKAHA